MKNEPIEEAHVVQASMLADAITQNVNESADTIEINCVLTGWAAKRFVLAHSLLTEGLGLSIQEATTYLVLAGAEKELSKLGQVYARIGQGE